MWCMRVCVRVNVMCESVCKRMNLVCEGMNSVCAGIIVCVWE